jgi:hypothetical protein
VLLDIRDDPSGGYNELSKGRQRRQGKSSALGDELILFKE